MLARAAGCTLDRTEPRAARAALSLLFFPSSFIRSLGAGRGQGRGSAALPSPHFSAKGGDPLLSLEVSGQRGRSKCVLLWSGRGRA